LNDLDHINAMLVLLLRF